MALTKRELYSQLRQPEAGMKPFTRAGGSNYLNMAPTLTGQGGAKFRRGGIEYALASLPEVQLEISSVFAEAISRAQAQLGHIRTKAFSFGDIRNHWVSIDPRGGRIDRTLMLTDTKNGTKGAMSIEYGRSQYEVKRKDGSVAKVGAMTGKFILHRAFGVAPNGLKDGGGNV